MFQKQIIVSLTISTNIRRIYIYKLYLHRFFGYWMSIFHYSLRNKCYGYTTKPILLFMFLLVCANIRGIAPKIGFRILSILSKGMSSRCCWSILLFYKYFYVFCLSGIILDLRVHKKQWLGTRLLLHKMLQRKYVQSSICTKAMEVTGKII